MANLEQELADRFTAQYNIDNAVALQMISDIIDIYELDFKSKLSKYHILAMMVRYFLSDYSSCYGNDETIRLLSTHLDIDMEEAEQLLKAFEELDIQ